MSRQWIKHPGALTRKAQRAHASGKTGDQARLYITLVNLRTKSDH